MTITVENFEDDVKWDLRAFLRDNLNDPIADERSDKDPFVWVGDTDKEVGDEDHKVPFLTLSLAGGNNSNIGPSKMGQSDEFSISINTQCVTGGIKHKDLLSKARNRIKEALDDTNSSVSPKGTGPNGREYDITPLSDPGYTSPADRTQYRDDNYKEVGVQMTFSAWFVE